MTVYLPPETPPAANGEFDKKFREAAGAAAAAAAVQAEEEQMKQQKKPK